MWIRVLVAGVVAGLLVFGAGAFEHMVLEWSARTMSHLPSETAAVEFARGQGLQPGIYGFPDHPANLNELPADEQKRVMKDIEERYKAGPNGWIIIGPSGQDMMGVTQFGGEIASNIAGALIAALVVALIVPRSFALRWAVVLLMGVFGWLSISASHYVWYRFPGLWVRDELFAAMLEWGLAGLVIAAIVRPCRACSKTAGDTEAGATADTRQSPAMAK
jgi:hypothetical protein